MAETRESSPKRETSQVRREMPLNAGKPNRSSSNGLAVGNDRYRGTGKEGGQQSRLVDRGRSGAKPPGVLHHVTTDI